MSQRRAEFMERVEAERARQINLPGSEFDRRHDPNDWMAIVGRYLFENVARAGSVPTREEFEDAMVKAAAIIAAAYEHVEVMENRDALR